MNPIDKNLLPNSHLTGTVNDTRFPYFSLGQAHTHLTQIDMQSDAWMISCTRNSTRNQMERLSKLREEKIVTMFLFSHNSR